MKRLFSNIVFFLLLIAECWAGGNSEKEAQSQKQTAPQAEQTTPASQFWTGDGGRGKSIAILAPQAIGLAANQAYIPALVQGEFVSNFSGYSAISVLDRVRLDDQYKELLSGYYSDNAQESWDLGHLSPTEYIMGGNITRTASGFAMQMSVTKSADKMTIASYSGTFTFDELDNLSGVRRASLDLLQKMGVVPTEQARTSLSGAAASNQINAQTALARGIVAQRLGDTVETMAQFYQAAAYDPSFAEAATRANTMSASVRTGSLGASIRNDIAWRDEWVKILADAQKSLQNIPIPQPPSLQQIVVAQIIAPEPKFKQGNVDYDARTAVLLVDFYLSNGLFPVPYSAEYLAAYDAYRAAYAVRSDVYNKIVEDLNAGLNATKRNGNWKLTTLSPITRDPPAIIPRRGDVTVSAIVELLNDKDRVIGNFTNTTFGTFTFGERDTVLKNIADIRQLEFKVKADDITDQVSLRIIASASPSQNNLVQVMTSAEFQAAGRVRTIPNGVTTIKDREFERKRLARIIIPNSVTSIGKGAFTNNNITNVNIPNSVSTIGDNAFANNSLTKVSIPNTVTSIGDYAFADNPITSITIGLRIWLGLKVFDGDFDAVYERNGSRMGTYTRSSPTSTDWKYNSR